MKTITKWLIAAAILVFVGIVICVIALIVLRFDVSRLSTKEYVENTYEASADFENINIKDDTEYITFKPSGDGSCRVVCYDDKEASHKVSTEGGTLTIEKVYPDKKLILNVGVDLETPTMTVYLPKYIYKDLTIHSDTGDVVISEDYAFDSIDITLDTGDITCLASTEGAMNLRTDTGDITLSYVKASAMSLSSDTGRMNLEFLAISGDFEIKEHTGHVNLVCTSCGALKSKGSSGDLNLEEVFAEGEMNLERGTGDIRLDGCDAASLTIKTDTGDVTGTLLSDKIFVTHSDTGRVNVPATSSGGTCKIDTDTGDISIDIRS